MPTTGASLPETAHEHHAAIQPHVDRLPELAAMIDTASPTEFAAAFEHECAFVTGQLVPHMEAIESTLYGQMERLMDRRHSMAPMREEHETLRRLISSLCGYRAMSLTGELTTEDTIGLRRVLYRLYTILKVHLAEEELYLRVLDRNLTAEEQETLAIGIRHAMAEPL
jgi:hypothetical protein